MAEANAYPPPSPPLLSAARLRAGAWADFAGRAAEAVLERCASPEIPWFLVPADKKWFRNLAVLERLVMALRPYRETWLATLKKVGKSALEEIRTLRERAQIGDEKKKKKKR